MGMGSVLYKAVASIEEFIADIRAEYDRAMLMHPDRDGRPQTMVAVLSEEHGEVSKALLDNERGTDTIDGVYTECVQTAAMAARLAIGGSAEFPSYTPPLTR